MKTIWCIPSDVETNKYMFQMQNAMRMAGYYVYGKGDNYKKIFCNIVHLNWFENIPKNGWSFFFFLKKSLFLLIMNLLGKRIVYTFHNKKPHEDGSKLSRKLMEMLLKKADVIIIHSMASKSFIKKHFLFVDIKKIQYIPLPNYRNVYSSNKEYLLKSKERDVFRVAFIGQVRPYKSVEVIIEVANRFANNKSLEFLICGKCLNDEYERNLRKAISSNNVIMDLRFIDDDEISSLMEKIDCVILPYNTSSALNSAAAILAFSFGKCVVSTNIGTVQDLQELGFNGVVCYEYSSSERVHEDRLYNGINELYEKWKKNRVAYKKYGEELKEYIFDNNSLEEISICLKKVYL